MKQMRSLYIVLCLMVGMSTLSGCIEEFEADIPADDSDLLVVEGAICSSRVNTFVLSRTQALNSSDELQKVVGAHVSVRGSDGSEYLAQGVYGQYVCQVGVLSPDVEYYLHIESDGEVYESEPQKPLRTEKIEDVRGMQLTPDSHIDILVTPAAPLNPDEVNYRLYEVVKNKGRQNSCPQTEIVEEESPVKRMKTVKNDTEIAGFRSAMLKDGIAMTKFLYWLSGYIGKPEISELTEIAIDEKLTSLRAEQPLYRDISFDTIAGYGTHAAIVHYEATPETDIPLQPKGMLLLDSGAQYLEGTTDITRTIALGPLTDLEKQIYTLVLKGHIQIELCKFPSGSSGTQIDILARKDMWREGLNYLHGTGHGVGTYLNVHEGPHQFRLEWKPAPLVAGMTITDEPGIYLPDRCGARTENTLLIVPYKETEFGKFLQFESLTLCPIDKAPILIEMMTQEEIQWLNDYHQRVFDTLSPHLSDDEAAWLREACAPLT